MVTDWSQGFDVGAAWHNTPDGGPRGVAFDAFSYRAFTIEGPSGVAMESNSVLACPSCGRANRVPIARLAQQPKCGACHAALRAEGHPIEVDEAQLEALLAHATVPVLVDFWAPWCGPCRAMAPELERLGRSMQHELLVAKIDTQAHPGAGARYQARSIPLFVLFERGRETWRTVGGRPAARLEAEVRQALGPSMRSQAR